MKYLSFENTSVYPSLQVKNKAFPILAKFTNLTESFNFNKEYK